MDSPWLDVEGDEINDFNVNVCLQEDPLLQQLKMLWESNETTSNDVGMSVYDKKALKEMEKTVTTVNRQYQMKLLWKEENPCLVNNKFLAESRLKLLKKRFKKDDDLFLMYQKGINEYLEKGYARENKPGKDHVVFDCAAKYKGTSLNSQLLQGPDLTNSLFIVLTRFCQEVAMMANIKRMFNQVKVDPRDIDALRFLWALLFKSRLALTQG